MAADPLVWILWRRRKGDLDQMLALTTALGWRHEVKRLTFHPPDVPALANLLLKSNSDSLAPPWPDVVLCAEALPSIVARKLKAKSNGAIRTVCIGRPAGMPDAFDLVITTAQYRLRPAPNIVELSMPLSAHHGSRVEQDYAFDGRRPLIAVLVGGSSFPDVLDGPAASQLARDVSRQAEKSDGTLAVMTSPRTGTDAIAVLKTDVIAPHRLHLFGDGHSNYREVLAAADQLIVTSDSVSMVADALETGKPVSIYRLPRKLNLQWRLAEWLHVHAAAKPWFWLAPVKWALDRGFFEISAERCLLFDRLVEGRQAAWFGTPAPRPDPEASRRDLDRAVQSVRAILA